MALWRSVLKGQSIDSECLTLKRQECLHVAHLGGVLHRMCFCAWPAHHGVGGTHCPLWQHRQRVQLHPHNVTGLADEFVESAGVHYPQPAASCKQLQTGEHWVPHTHKANSYSPLSGRCCCRCWRTSASSESRDWASVFLSQSSLMSVYTPSDPLRSTTNSFVFATLSCRWFCSHNVTKFPTTALYPLPCLLTLADTSNYSRVIREPLSLCGGWSPWCIGWRGRETGLSPQEPQCCWPLCPTYSVASAHTVVCQSGSWQSRTRGGHPPASLSASQPAG